MNAGVSMLPRAKVMRPRRAALSVERSWNCMLLMGNGAWGNNRPLPHCWRWGRGLGEGATHRTAETTSYSDPHPPHPALSPKASLGERVLSEACARFGKINIASPYEKKR